MSISPERGIADLGAFDIHPDVTSLDYKSENGRYVYGENEESDSFSFTYTSGLLLPERFPSMPFESEKNTFYIHELHVAHGSGGKGIGTAALLLAANYAVADGMTHMRLGITNPAVVKCLEKLDGQDIIGDRHYLPQNGMPGNPITTQELVSSADLVDADTAITLLAESIKQRELHDLGNQPSTMDYRLFIHSINSVVSLR